MYFYLYSYYYVYIFSSTTIDVAVLNIGRPYTKIQIFGNILNLVVKYSIRKNLSTIIQLVRIV